jgi:hypothetical protein
MKKFVFHLILLLTPVWQIFAHEIDASEWGAATNNAQMSIRFLSGGNPFIFPNTAVPIPGNKIEIKPNEKVFLTIQIKNLSANESLSGSRGYENIDPSFVVISPFGRNLLPKDSNRELFGSGGSSAIIFIPPSQITKFSFELSTLCGFGSVGTYKVTATQFLYSGTIIKSRSLLLRSLSKLSQMRIDIG